MCKAYRVYFSTPPPKEGDDQSEKPFFECSPSPSPFPLTSRHIPVPFLSELPIVSLITPALDAPADYLVDHSIYFYLMDPDGRFVQAFGKNSTAEDVAFHVEAEIEKWGRGERGPTVP